MCKKSYCFMKRAISHNNKKHEGKAKFDDLQEIRI
jgi:hypothetical protein